MPVINDKAAGSGFVSLVGASNDGIVRTAPLISRIGDTLLPSLSVEALRVAQGAGAIVVKSTTGSGEMGGSSVQGVVALKVGAFEIPTTPNGGLWMYYTEPHPERVVPAWKIMTGALSADQMKTLFAGRIVFIGTGAAGLRDLVSTPVRHNELGVVVHAQAVEQAILGRFLIRPDWSLGLERAILLVLGIGISLSLPGLGALRGGILSLVAFAAAAGGSWFAFRYGALLLDPTYPAAAVISVYIAGHCACRSIAKSARALTFARPSTAICRRAGGAYRPRPGPARARRRGARHDRHVLRHQKLLTHVGEADRA